MIVVDPPEREHRRYQREWGADHWRGTPDEFVSAVEAALEELKPHISYEARPTATFEFRDESHQIVNSIDALRQTAESSKPSEIKNLSVEVSGPPSFTISGTASKGLTVRAEGSQGFAVGLVGMLSFRFSKGAEAGTKASGPAIRPIERFLIGLSPALAIAIFFYSYVASESPSAFDLLGGILISILGGGMPLLLAASLAEDHARRTGPPRFVLVAEGEQFLDERELQNGPIWRAKDWFDHHPLFKLSLTLLAGAVIAEGLHGLLS